MGDCTLYRWVTVSAGYAWQTTSRLASQRWEVRELRNCWTWPVWRRKSYGMGRISVRSRTELLVLNGTLTGQRYINEVLQPVVLSFVQQHHVVLQDDNARPHRARIVQQFLQQYIVDHLEWPDRSPDLSPIEHVWDILGQRVRQRVPRPRTLQALGAALQEEWRRIPLLQIARLIRSMRRRCVACIDATGGHTRYWQICEVLLVTLVIFHTNFLIHF